MSRMKKAPTALTVRASNLPVNLQEKTNMNIVARNELTFHGFTFSTTEHKGQIWFTATELAKALEYKKTDAVTQIYSRAKDEFTESMSTTLNLRVVRKTGDVDMNVRVFSLRGAHLVAMFAGTPVAKEFRRWVLDILDREVEKQPELTPFYRYKARLELRDDMTGERFEILGMAQDMRQVAFGLANDLGYRPNAFTHVPVNQKKLRKIH